MPGYDFYEFYKTIASTGMANEQTYKMAYQMAKSLDKTITPEKLTKDAEFYVSKISEVHGQYVSQGQQKLNSLQQEKSSEKTKLMNEVDAASIRIAHLKVELQQLESEVNSKKTLLAKIDETYYPKEKAIKEKMNANDLARKTSVDKLSSIKEGILRYIKI
jgi:vacuolar-type H+-ATPase subunit I/STV1